MLFCSALVDVVVGLCCKLTVLHGPAWRRSRLAAGRGSCEPDILRPAKLEHPVQYPARPVRASCSPKPLPAHAPALGDGPQVLVALGWRRLGHGTWHGTGPGRHDHGSTGVPCGDLAVNAVLIIGTIGREGGDWVRELVEQMTDLAGVINVACRQ